VQRLLLIRFGSIPRRRTVGQLYFLLLAMNLGVWAWAFMLFRDQPLMLSTSVLAYGLGLRHAVDADHIAAIDNVTRKLIGQCQEARDVGFWFAIGHSSVVFVAATLIAVAANAFSRVGSFRDAGGLVATSISATFLFTIAILNLVILGSVWSAFIRVKRGQPYVEEDLDVLLSGRGLLARLFRPLFRMVNRSWHMAPLGFLFGLGFDTATEVTLLGISAAQGAKGMGVSTLLVFPVLFAAGMALVDTTDGVLMVRAYSWAFVRPLRKLYYNLTVTLVSALVALLIGGAEVLSMVARHYGLRGRLWEWMQGASDHLGFAIIGLFALFWIVSVIFYHVMGYERLPQTAIIEQ
jgi:nickel/cobalt transporter (NiCoT) family protein